ncbi:GIY-YIG nuclease family protein [Prochlorococcus marinus]|uniref:GIY-YIG nuclease family protein n=1 Tax=Prochlorococcus marinus TaxID=1219 RepID=UPI0022B2F125|nr:GIY-YIG nuclease family protein [Prochlorococcus marinus]
MIGWLYLIRNRDLYKIGITKNFKNRMKQLKPDDVVAKLYSRDFIKLEREFHIRYKKFRIPQTEYFRLEDYHLKEIKERISKINFSISIILGIFFKSFLFILIISFLLIIIISLNVNDLTIIISKSLFWMERISFGYSFVSLCASSGKYLSFVSELKYRFLRSICIFIFAFIFRISLNFL